MKRIEESSRLTPKPAEPRMSDLFSETVSDASKGNAARFYAEMMIDLFLSDRLKEELQVGSLEKIALSDQIQKISAYTDSSIIDALWRINNFGDKASHYSKHQVLTTAEADAAVEDAVSIIVQILTDELVKIPLAAFSARPTLFSTILPKARAEVLLNLLKKCVRADEKIDPGAEISLPHPTSCCTLTTIGILSFRQGSGERRHLGQFQLSANT